MAELDLAAIEAWSWSLKARHGETTRLLVTEVERLRECLAQTEIVLTAVRTHLRELEWRNLPDVNMALARIAEWDMSNQ